MVQLKFIVTALPIKHTGLLINDSTSEEMTMLTQLQTEKLRLEMKRELCTGTGLAIRCAGLFLLIAVLACIGEFRESTAGRQSSSPPTSAAERVRYSRIVFEERRRRYVAAFPESKIAHETAQKDANSDGGYE